MKKTAYVASMILAAAVSLGCSGGESAEERRKEELAQTILADRDLQTVLERARTIIGTGFNAGDGYGQVWIRDFATFIEISCDVCDRATVRENLLTFFKFQGEDGNIVDGFAPLDGVDKNDRTLITSPGAPGLYAHKNSVETDQESSLVHAVYLYILKTGDRSILSETFDGQSVLRRMERSLEYLLNHRFSPRYGLLWGATTADWGDVQPEHEWGIDMDESTHRAIDIYDNAMFLIAIDGYRSFLEPGSAEHARWGDVRSAVRDSIRTHLWMPDRNKFRPHIYLEEGSPFPDGFDEDVIHYHGGTAVAVQAGLLSEDEIAAVADTMVANVRASGAGSIGLTVYPPYPEGFFRNPGMGPYSYQNGGDWTWFGGRMIRELVRHGLVEEAYREILPMVRRVIENDGFYEWYSVRNEPRGSGTFRGEAGVLGTAIMDLIGWAESRAVAETAGAEKRPQTRER